MDVLENEGMKELENEGMSQNQLLPRLARECVMESENEGMRV